VVPYPEEIAGTPGTYTLDRTGWVMHLQYSTASVDPKMACTGAATEVFVPRRDYPHGYRVRVTGGRVVSPPSWPWVEVVANRGARQVSLTVSQAKDSTTQVATSAIDPRAPVPTCHHVNG
jgi:endoglycosylceramidase